MSDAATIVEMAVHKEEKVKRAVALMKKRIAKRGSLGLPPLLEKRRLQHLIPDGAFRVQASFERVLVYEMAPAEQASMESSLIQLTDKTKDRLKDSSPRGIIVSAGLAALDSLRTNGMDLGHIVLFTHYVIGTVPIEYIEGKEITVKIMHAGDITGSEDTAEAVRKGELEIAWNDEGKFHEYRRKGDKRKSREPIVPKRLLKSI